MNRIAAALTALALSIVAAPSANAGLASSDLSIVLDFPGPMNQISLEFELRDASTGQVLDTVDAVYAEKRGAIIAFVLDTAEESWDVDEDVEWCAIIDAQNVSAHPIKIRDVMNRADDETRLSYGNGTNFAGGIGEICVAGTSTY